MAFGEKEIDERPKRVYRPLNESCGFREPVRDGMNMSDVDRACERWLRDNDPSYKAGCVSNSYIEYYD